MSRRDQHGKRSADRDRVTHMVHAAVVDLLSAGGYPGVTMEAVTAASGVAKTTIYRRWGTKAFMIFDVVVHAAVDQAQLPIGDSDEQDIAILAQRIVDLTTTAHAPGVLLGLLAEIHLDSDLRQSFFERAVIPGRAAVRSLLSRVQERGAATRIPDPDAVHAALFATALMHAAFQQTHGLQAVIERQLRDALGLPEEKS